MGNWWNNTWVSTLTACLQIALGSLLRSRQRGKYRCFTEVRLRVSTQPRYRIPDVFVMALPHAREPVLTHPPHLVVEIVSPDDADREGLRACPSLIVETDLVGRVDFRELFAEVDEPSE